MTRIIFGLFVISLLCIYAEAQLIIDCGPDSVPAPCAKSCEPTCQYQMEKPCKINNTCPTQCRCRSGLVRNEESHQCVTPNNCPK